MDWFFVGVGGFFGAITRYLVSIEVNRTFTALTGIAAPYGTAFVNISGSFLLGLFAGLALRHIDTTHELYLLIGVGFFGAYTTFSTFSTESITLLRAGRWEIALAHIVLTTGLCLIGAFLGLWVSGGVS